MSELTAGTNSQTKNAALIEAVNEMSKDLLSDPSLDIRIGMVNFYHNSTAINNHEQISSDIFPLTNDINRLTGSENTALNRTPIGGTPLTLGLKMAMKHCIKTMAEKIEIQKNPNRCGRWDTDLQLCTDSVKLSYEH